MSKKIMKRAQELLDKTNNKKSSNKQQRKVETQVGKRAEKIFLTTNKE